MKTTHRLLYIDILRVLACFLVLLTHSSMKVDDVSFGPYLGLFSFMGSAAPDLFLSLSGALLLPVNIGIRDFYKRRFFKIIPPVVLWSIIILGLYWLIGKRTLAEAIEGILFLPLKPVIGVYWFVYVMIGLYLFAPFISKWLAGASKKHVELFLLLWFVNLCMPYLNLLLGDNGINHNTYYWELNYFGGFLGYWLIGYYLRYYPIAIGCNWRFLCVCGGVVAYVLVIIGYKMVLDGESSVIFNDNLQTGSAFVVVMLYTIAQNIRVRQEWLRNAISDVAKMSFGIYLIHIVIVRVVMWPIFADINLHPAIETPLIALVSMAVCYLIIKAISYLPGSKYLIGV